MHDVTVRSIRMFMHYDHVNHDQVASVNHACSLFTFVIVIICLGIAVANDELNFDKW